MKNLFYKVGFTVLIIAAVLGITGGVAMAASPPGNTILGNIQAVVTNIWNSLNSPDDGLSAISAKLDGVTAMETGSGTIVSLLDESSGIGYGEYERTNDGIRHVSLTWRLLGLKKGAKADYFTIFADAPTLAQVAEQRGLEGDPYGIFCGTVEFDASSWKIQAWDYDEDPANNVTVYFTYTETYPK